MFYYLLTLNIMSCKIKRKIHNLPFYNFLIYIIDILKN